MIDVEVAFARADVQRVSAFRVPAGTSVRDVLALSKLADEFPEIDPVVCPLGVFGKQVDDSYTPNAGDRIEVYRELRIDPRQARRERAKT